MKRWLIAGSVLLILIILVGGYFIWRNRRANLYGETIALCPGPDYYGYTCENGAAYAYIDAFDDTQLYALDGVITLPLPFPFTFYGTTYTELTASSNGNVQFNNANTNYANACLKPAIDMGDMIAPYWDDLDLRYEGFLETAVVGEAPNRIMVIEWDSIPRYETNEPVTFELQLHENNDIVFLYESVTQSSGHNGQKATIGLQSEAQELVLQFGCNQPVVADAAQIKFPYPNSPNGAVAGVETAHAFVPQETAVLRSIPEQIVTSLNLHGLQALASLNRGWLNQSPPLTAVWEQMDLTGDGQTELIVLLNSTASHPGKTALMVYAQSEDGWMLLHETYPGNRTQPVTSLTPLEIADVTSDDLPDLLLQDASSGLLFVLHSIDGTPELTAVPQLCTGETAVRDGAIVRDGCAAPGRITTLWDGSTFQIVP